MRSSSVTLRSALKVTEKYIIDNSPMLLSAVAVTGTMTVAYLTGKATFRAAEIIADEQEKRALQELGKPLETKDKAKLVWKEYIPPALVVVGTVSCIVAANSISASRMAALAAAYKVSEKQYTEYKDKVLEKLGLKEEKALRDEINRDYIRANPPSDDIQMLATEDEVLFLEKWTGRYFRSKLHLIQAAENRLNKRMITENYATLTDFYDELGLAKTQESDEIGWCIENPIDLDFTAGTADGGTRPIFVMEYANRPMAIRDYHQLYPRH